MPIFFADTLGSGPGATYPAVDATDQTVKGIGHFNTLNDVYTTASNFQKIPGFIAVILSPTVALYQYTGSDASEWDNVSFWKEIGEIPPAAEYTVLNDTDVTVNPFGAYDPSAALPLRTNFDAIPVDAQVIPVNGSNAQIYDTATQGGAPEYQPGNTFLGPLTNVNGPLSSFISDTALSDLAFNGSVKIGYEFLSPNFNFNPANEASINGLNWTAAPTNDVYDFLVCIPPSVRPYIFHLYMPVDSVNDEIYLGYKSYDLGTDATVWDDANWGDPNNWTVLNEAGTNHLGLKVVDSTTDQTTFDLNAAYPVVNSQVWQQITNGSPTIGSLDNLAIVLSLNLSTRTHLESLKTTADDQSQFNEVDSVQVKLSTKIVVS